MDRTINQYDHIISICRELFLKKAKDYGTSWRIMRLPSVTDQLFIKAKRIRTLEETGLSKVGEDIDSEYIGIVNYCVIAMIQLELTPLMDGLGSQETEQEELTKENVAAYYDRVVHETRELMLAKNHDYGEAWRDMRMESLTDMILMKLHRTKEIENNEGKTLVSEGVKANYQDMMNYAIFALINLRG